MGSGREMEECGESIVRLGGEVDAAGFGAFDIAYSIFRSSDMGRGEIEGMLSKDGCDGGEVRAGDVGQPEE